jgi:hypothetical protein
MHTVSLSGLIIGILKPDRDISVEPRQRKLGLLDRDLFRAKGIHPKKQEKDFSHNTYTLPLTLLVGLRVSAVA